VFEPSTESHFMARNFETPKNKEPLYWAIGLLIGAIWCIRDGWFPPGSVLEDHPEFPENTWSLALQYEYYRFNRVTGVLMAVASAVMFVVYRMINRP